MILQGQMLDGFFLFLEKNVCMHFGKTFGLQRPNYSNSRVQYTVSSCHVVSGKGSFASHQHSNSSWHWSGTTPSLQSLASHVVERQSHCRHYSLDVFLLIFLLFFFKNNLFIYLRGSIIKGRSERNPPSAGSLLKQLQRPGWTQVFFIWVSHVSAGAQSFGPSFHHFPRCIVKDRG